MKRSERPFTQIPRPLLAGFVLILLTQLVAHQLSLLPDANDYQPLSAPFSASTYRSLAMGSDHLLSYLLAIRLQLHDNQAGKHVRYERMDYAVLVRWLEQIDQLNTNSEYPVMLAARVYSQVNDQQRLRVIIDYVQTQFAKNPQLHWRRQAEAIVIAKHRLGDLTLALALAEQLSNQPAHIVMPQWARDMQFLILAELNEFETGIALITALLQSGSITDADEKRFLKAKLLEFQQKLLESRQK